MESVSILKVYYSNRSSICVDLLKELNVELKGPFNIAARDEAGIPRDWYARNNKFLDPTQYYKYHQLNELLFEIMCVGMMIHL